MFRPFLVATQFEIPTDHNALQWLRTMKNESALLHSWAASLEDYRFTILHRPGKLQGHVDGLSRLPLASPTFTLEGHLGEHKTWKAFNRKFVTAEGRKKCREIVRTYPECQLGKDYKQRHLLKGTIESSKPWDVVSIDIMGPFPYDDQAKRFIVTIMDVYSRYIMALFFLFINDLLHATASDVHSFADDSNLHKSSSFQCQPSSNARSQSRIAMSSTINSDLQSISEWGTRNLVKFNTSKTQLLTISLSNTPSNYPIIFEDSEIPSLNSVNILGLQISSSLSWRDHIVQIAK